MDFPSLLSLGSETLLESLRFQAAHVSSSLRNQLQEDRFLADVAADPSGQPERCPLWEMAYLAQHTALWSALKPLWQRSYGRSIRFLEPRFHALLERDILNVREQRYPRSLLFQWRFRNDLRAELRFLGTADIARRMVIPALVEAGRERPRILDLGCGTGRSLLQLQAALPRAELFGLDINPESLAQARRLLANLRWLSLIRGAAEATDFRDGTFDAVTSTFLLHVLSPDVRRQVMVEMHRLVRPGGRLVLCDYLQSQDAEEQVQNCLSELASHHRERHFARYQADSLEHALIDAGFVLERTEQAYLSKIVVARRPFPQGVH